MRTCMFLDLFHIVKWFRFFLHNEFTFLTRLIYFEIRIYCLIWAYFDSKIFTFIFPGTVLYNFTGISTLNFSSGEHSPFQITNDSVYWTIQTKTGLDFETVNTYFLFFFLDIQEINHASFLYIFTRNSLPKNLESWIFTQWVGLSDFKYFRYFIIISLGKERGYSFEQI